MMSLSNELTSTCGRVLLEALGMAYFSEQGNHISAHSTIAALILSNTTAKTTANFSA